MSRGKKQKIRVERMSRKKNDEETEKVRQVYIQCRVRRIRWIALHSHIRLMGNLNMVYIQISYIYTQISYIYTIYNIVSIVYQRLWAGGRLKIGFTTVQWAFHSSAGNRKEDRDPPFILDSVQFTLYYLQYSQIYILLVYAFFIPISFQPFFISSQYSFHL